MQPSRKKRKKCSSKVKVLDDEELEMIHSYYQEHNKSNSDNMEENKENVKSLKVICKEKLESMSRRSRSNRVYVKHVMPIQNTISYTEYKGKTYRQKRKFLEENSRQVLAHYQKETTKKLKQNANDDEINQHDNDTLAYEMWKSSVRRSFNPKKVQNTLKIPQIPQIDSAEIAEIDKMPEHRAVVL